MVCGGMSVLKPMDHFGYIITQKNAVIVDVHNQKEFYIMQMELKIKGVVQEMYEMNIEETKQVYNWFYHAFEKDDNPRCTQEDIILKEKLENWLIKQEQ